MGRTLAQTQSPGNIYITPHVLASAHAPRMPTGPQPYSPGPLPVAQSAYVLRMPGRQFPLCVCLVCLCVWVYVCVHACVGARVCGCVYSRVCR